MVYYVYSKGNKKKEEDVLIMEKTFNVTYDLQLNYEDSEGVEIKDLFSITLEMLESEEYEELEEMRDWLQAKLAKLDELANNESDSITYNKLLAENKKTSESLEGVKFAIEMLEARD